jgi:hypothetical protein
MGVLHDERNAKYVVKRADWALFSQLPKIEETSPQYIPLQIHTPIAGLGRFLLTKSYF